VADRAFAETAIMRVAQVDEAAAERRSMSLIAFRESANRLVDGASVVASIPLPPGRDPQVAQDGEGRLYVAVPSSEGSATRRDVYWGSILRFASDGRVAWSTDQRSAVWARGFDRPTAIAFDAVDGRIWAAGDEGGSHVMRVHLPGGFPVRTVRLGPAARSRVDSTPEVFGLAAVGLRATEIRRRAAMRGDAWPLSAAVDMNRLRQLSVELLGDSEPLSIGAGADGATYVVTRGGDKPHLHSIFRVTPQRADPRPR
jgi:hypothetical protein